MSVVSSRTSFVFTDGSPQRIDSIVTKKLILGPDMSFLTLQGTLNNNFWQTRPSWIVAIVSQSIRIDFSTRWYFRKLPPTLLVGYILEKIWLVDVIFEDISKIGLLHISDNFCDLHRQTVSELC